MFSREEFMSYVGSASGSSYAAGLKAIESIYGVDIDAEYAGDKCHNLFQKLEQDNEEIPLAQRYVDFRAAFDEFYKPQKLNHYQDLHAISVYIVVLIVK